MESLASGTYIIRSQSVDGAFVGRNVNEETSLLPKSVVLLPKDIKIVPKWEITSLHHGIYIMKARGDHVSDIDKHLFAILTPKPTATEWLIQAHPQHGKNIYTIWVAGKGRADGWISPKKLHQQIMVDHHSVAPPLYPFVELFEITPCD